MSPPLPSANRRRLLGFLAIVLWPMVLFPYLFVVPRYEKLFREQHISLPIYPLTILEIAMWARSYSLVLFAIIATLALVSAMLVNQVETRPMPRIRRNLYLALIFGVPCILFALTWLGVWSTHRTLVEGLNR